MRKLGTRANNSQKSIQYLFKRPMIDINKVLEITGVSKRTAYNLIDDLERLEILKEVTGDKRHKLYVFDAY